MDTSSLIFALKISGIGIVVLLLVLVVLAFVVSLMTKFIVEKPEDETIEEVAQPQIEAKSEESSDLQLVAAIALALYRAQTETQTVSTASSAGEINAWKQFNLQRRLAQSSSLRRIR